MYTTETMRKVSQQLGRHAEDHMFERSVAVLKAMGELPRRKPPSRRRRFQWWVQDYRNRLRLAVEVMKGEHDCGDW